MSPGPAEPAGARPRGADTTTVGTRDGATVAVHRLGGDGPPLLLVHAAGFHGMTWAPLARRLAGLFACVAPDLRGHGDSEPPSGWDGDWRGFATDLLAVVDALGLDRPRGVGHSSGATALLLAEQARPGLFRSLYCHEPVIVPADPPLGRDPDNWLAERTRGRRASFASRGEAEEHYRDRPPLSELAPDVLRAYLEHGLGDAGDGTLRLKCDPGLEADVYEMATAHDCFPRLGRIRCPVTVSWGGRSEAFGSPHAAELAGRIPEMDTVVHGELGHMGPLQDPGTVAASIRRSLTGGRAGD